jgi:hypothetical protein
VECVAEIVPETRAELREALRPDPGSTEAREALAALDAQQRQQ